MQTNQAPKIVKIFKGKKLDVLIQLSYGAHAEGRTINVMDIGKVFAEARTAYASALAATNDPHAAVKALDAAIVLAVEKYTQPSGGAS